MFILLYSFRRVLGGIVAIMGVGLVALAAGIVATSFAEVLEKKKQKQKVYIQRCPYCGKPISQSSDHLKDNDIDRH